jgi:zinc transporter ZupT
MFFVKDISHSRLCALISLAAGALLSVVILDIIPETIELVGLLETAGAILLGYATFYLIGKYIYHICPACAATHKESMFRVTILMVVALSLHSFMDGIAIAVGHETGASLGYIIFFAVAYHKFPEGLALASVAVSSGYSRKKAVGITMLVEASTTLTGGFIGALALAGSAPIWYGFVLGHVGGGFAYLIIHALLGEMIKHEKRSTSFFATLGFVSLSIIGLIITAIISA